MTAVLAILGWLDLLGTALLAGGAAYAAWVAPLTRTGRRAAHAGALLVAVTLLLEAGATGLRLSALASSGGPLLMWNVLATHWGALWVVRCVGLAIIVACRLGSPAQLVFIALWLMARSFQGHAGAHGTLPALVDWVHLSAACAWMGGLLQFLLSRANASASGTVGLRRAATVSVAALLPAGVYGVFLHVPTLTDLVSSAYGLVLVAKISIALCLLTLGARNHFVHVPALQGDSTTALGRLRRSVRLEVAGGVLVLLLSALLGALPMPAPAPH